MLKFFRKIRQKSLTENRFGRYLIYAVGEIALVIIGILIALQINNWNESNKSFERGQKYLSNISEELMIDSVILHRSWFGDESKKIAYLQMARQWILDDYTVTDTLAFINNVGFGGINSNASLIGNSRTYQELVSTGSLSLIANDDIRSDIVEYYGRKELTRKYLEDQKTNYAAYFNSLKAFNPGYPDSINTAEIPRILDKIKTDEFHSLINRELTYSYITSRALHRNISRAHKLRQKIDKYLSDN